MDNSHTLGVKEVLKALQVEASQGLSDDEVLKRREEYGPNGNLKFPPRASDSPKRDLATIPDCRVAQRGGNAPVEADFGAIRGPAGANPLAGGRGLLCAGFF